MKVIVTAGPTREFIDPVRFLSNRSSGRMGVDIAAALVEKGHDVLLVAGPVSCQVPDNIRTVSVVSAADMLQAVQVEFEQCDALVMAAAVADWRPADIAADKLKKSQGAPRIELVRTDDILSSLAPQKGRRIVAGFAAETSRIEEEGVRKLKDKNLDVIFANDVSSPDAGFEVTTNRIVCIDSEGTCDAWPLMSKAEAGERIASVMERLYAERTD
jgi:phosphopantothenoylcysteine decarboxylase/phosphopantothenate--cysteine ligase